MKTIKCRHFQVLFVVQYTVFCTQKLSLENGNH